MSPVLAARVSRQFAGKGGILIILLAAILWGTVGVTTRAVFTLLETTALTVAFLRLAVALPVLAVSAAAVLEAARIPCQTTSSPAHGRHRDHAGGLPVVLLPGRSAGRCGGGDTGHAVRRAVIVALISTVFLGERPTHRLLFSAVLAIGGTMLLITPGGPAEGAVQGNETMVGLLLALGSATGYALVAIAGRVIAREAHPLTSMTVGFDARGVGVVAGAAAGGRARQLFAEAWGLLLYLGIVPSALAYVLFTIGMRTTVATVASLVTLIEPLTAAALAWLLFDEHLGPLALVGAALLMGAVFLLTQGVARARRRTERERLASPSSPCPRQTRVHFSGSGADSRGART